MLEPREPRSVASRGRGRPAKLFALTESGRDQLRPAVRRPGRPGAAVPRRDRRRGRRPGIRRTAAWRSSRSGSTSWSTANPQLSPVEALAQVFTDEGYAASVRDLPVVGEQLCQQHCPVSHVAHEFPAAVRGRDRGHRPGPRPARPAAGDDRPRRRRLHHLHSRTRSASTDTDHRQEGAGHSMTTIEERNPELEGIGRYEFGWRDSDDAGADGQARPQRGRRPRHLLEEERAAVDARPAPEGPQALPPQADADLGFGPVDDRLRQHQVLRPVQREAGRHLGRPPRGHQEHLRQARHPRGGEAAPGLRCRRAVRVRGRLPLDPRGPRGAGRPLPGHRHRAARAAGAVQGVLRHRHPGR